VGEGPATFPLDRRGSFAWLAPGWMWRASCALSVDGGCIVCDPVDVPGLDGALARAGPVLCVWTLLVRHRRDGSAVAARHGVPLLGPAEVLAGHANGEIDVRLLAGSQARPSEVALWLPRRRLLVCPESLGTAPLYLARPGDRLGTHPLGRLRPPRAALSDLDPDMIAVGHGPPLGDHATEALARALARARTDLPRSWLRILGLGAAALRRRAASRA
jgi:hypothetical protein